MFARAAQCDDFDALKVALAAAKNAVIAVWVQVFGGKRRGSK
jgi:hypothetical protein